MLRIVMQQKPTPLPTVGELLRRLDVDVETGRLSWLPITPEDAGGCSPERKAWQAAAWNGKHAGKPAGTVDKEGYLVVRYAGRRIYAHRLIWKVAHGVDPSQIDHIDRDRSNNRLSNLRLADPASNGANRSVRRDSFSGLKGAYKNVNGWFSSIYVRGEKHSLGMFGCPTAAHIAYRKASARLCGEFSPYART